MERHELDKLRNEWGFYAFPIYNGPFVICSNDPPNNTFICKHTHSSFATSPAIVNIMKRSKTKNFHSIMAPFIAEQKAVIIPQRIEEQPLNSIRKQTHINTSAIEGMIISEFARLDIADTGNILAFCNKYGLPFSNPVLNKFTITQEIANGQTYGLFLDEFSQYVIFMKQLLKLASTVTSKSEFNLRSTLETIIYFLFTADYKRSEHVVLKSFPATWLAEIKNSFDEYCRDICSFCEVNTVPKSMVSQIQSNKKLLVGYSKCMVDLHNRKMKLQTRGREHTESPQGADAFDFETSIEIIKLLHHILEAQIKNRNVEVLLANRYGEILVTGTIDCSAELKKQVISFVKKLLCEILNMNLKQTHVAVAIETSDNDVESIKGAMSVKSLSDIMFTELYLLLTVPGILEKCKRCKQPFIKINKRSHAIYCCKRCKDAAMQYYKRHPEEDHRKL